MEVLSGQKFEIYVKEHIFNPLGMESSDFVHPVEDWNGFARQYRYHSETGEYEPVWENAYRPVKEYAGGGAGCVSTVEDYIRFLEALRVGNVILKKETIAMMATDRLTEQQRQMYTYDNVVNGYGLGLRTPRLDPTWTEWLGRCGRRLRLGRPGKQYHFLLCPAHSQCTYQTSATLAVPRNTC